MAIKVIDKLNKWANAHTYLPLDLLRIGLGAFLFVKGVDFITQTQYLVDILNPIDKHALGIWVAHYVAMSHLAGGVLIAIGMLTRLSIIVQLPILFGAVMINFIGVMDPGNLLQASIALTAALFFSFYGSGKNSIDYSLKLHM